MQIFAKVKPNSLNDSIKPIDVNHYEITVTAPARHNLANKAVISIVAKYFKVARSLISIKRGSQSKIKTITINLNQNFQF